MEANVRLRPLERGHEDELRRIHATPEVARWWGEPEEGFPWTDDPDARRYAILLEGAVAGLIQYAEESAPRYRHASVDLFIDPAVRGRGIGGQALKLIVELLAAQGHHRVTIDPALENTAAIRAYAKAGFERVGTMRAYEREPDGERWRDALLMELILS